MSRVMLHRCCEHSAAEIRRGLVVRPTGLSPVSWWSDLPGDGDGTRAALGLTSVILNCDRMAHTFECLQPERLVPYFSHTARDVLPREWRRVLERAPGVIPSHWWMAAQPVLVREVAL